MWQAIRRVLFWTYSRGSWQYDIIVLVILVFIFLAPATLFDGTLLGRGPERASDTRAAEKLPVVAKPSPEGEKKSAAEASEKQEPPGR